MTLSIIFFLAYIVIAVVIGIMASREETEEDFMIAERRVEGTQVAATMSASSFDGATLAIYLAYVYQYGFSAIWLFVGIPLGFLFVRRYAWRIKQKADALGIYSMPEYFYKMFGKRNGLMFSLYNVLQFFLLLTVNFIVSGKILAAIFPISYPLAVVIGGVVILVYLLLAGFKAVVHTDYFQVIIMFVMALSVGVFFFGKTHISLADFNLGTMGAGNIVGFLVLSSLAMSVAPDLWQRIFATKDEKNLKRGLNHSAVIILVLGIVITVVGLATKQFFPNIVPEDALIVGFSSILPFGLKEFGMVLLYAVALSSSDTGTFVISSILTRDLKNYTKKFNEKSMRKLTRFFMVLVITAVVLIAIFYQNILALGFSLASLGLGYFPVILGSFYWKLKRPAVFWSLVLGLLSVVGLFVTNQLNPENAILPLPVVLISLIILQRVFRADPAIAIA